jgi:hypothetical protein
MPRGRFAPVRPRTTYDRRLAGRNREIGKDALIMRKLVTATLVGVSFIGAAAVAIPAIADPTAGTYRELSGVGSDTTDPVMDGLSNAITISGVKVIGNYNAVGTATIATKADPKCAAIARPNGSGAGRTALDASLTAADGCIDFARSSSGVATTTNPMTWVPFATDAVAFAVRSDGAVAKSLTTAEVVSVFKCQVPTVHPILPQAGSGTRSFWLGKMGVTEADIAAGTYPCLTGAGTATSRAYVQEHDARKLRTDEVMPFSVSQWNAQATGVIADVRGKSVLGTLDNVPASTLTTTYPYARSVYNIIPTGKVATAPWSTVFVGASSLVCAQAAVITKYGFAPNANCGDTSAHS